MLIRLPFAFILGLTIYMIAMMMTTYDVVLSMIFQPVMGAIITVLGLGVVCLAGSPLLITGIWNQWRRVWWLPVLITFAGCVACIISWHPSLREKVINPETHAEVESFHPALICGGWFASMFGVMFCPLGLRGDRRWV